MNRKFIIYAGPYDENIGGSIVLHLLCDLINKNSRKAYLWPMGKPVFESDKPLTSIYKIIKYWLRKHENRFKRYYKLDTPIAKYSDLKNAIIIYPEIIDGNPLEAKKIVRWFLHKPGFHTNKINYGEGELYFFYQRIFNDKTINPNDDNLLHIMLLRDDLYINKNLKNRKGSCYMIRKGKGRKIIHDLIDSICLDGMSHEEISEVFNNTKVFISYDLYTMYSRLAALCGCVSVVIPDSNLSKEEWQPVEELRHGIAYGFDDIDYAIETQKLVAPYFKKQDEDMNTNVRQFIKKCDIFF